MVGDSMAKRVKKTVSKQRSNPGSRRNVLESITGDDALAILKALAASDRRLALEIEAIAKERFSSVEMDAIAADVMMGLESLVVEDVFDRSGSKRDGYVDPGEAAWEMFEEALQPTWDEVGKYQQLSMLHEADVVCQGILKGIYDFEQECSSEYKELAVDAPAEYFGRVLDDWKKLFGQRPPVDRMTEFLKTHCSAWAARAVKSLRVRSR
jgi:hypothetical protein